MLVGGAVGVASGLLGIGGGVLMVPFIYLLMAEAGWSGLIVPPGHQAQMAHASSLAVIVPTAVSGLVAYGRQGAVIWASVLSLGLAAGVSAFFGARLAALLPSVALKVAFGGFLVVMAWRLRGRGDSASPPGGPTGGDGARRLRWHVALAGGGLVGFLSALLGVGGGIVAIPILIHWARLDLHRVAAASLGVITFAALAGTVGYALAGQAVDGLPAGSLGYVHLPLVLAMLPGAVFLAPTGARLNQRLPVDTLRRLFALLLLVVGLRLVWVNGGEMLAAL